MAVRYLCKQLPLELCQLVRHQSTQAAKATPSPFSSVFAPSASIDPFRLVSREIGQLRTSILSLMGSRHPALDRLAKYYFQGSEAKQIRPMVILLMAQATNGLAPGFKGILEIALKGGTLINAPISPKEVLGDENPDEPCLASFFMPSDPLQHGIDNVLPSQRRLAEITEMIHVASLLHDDVIDTAETRRQQPSAPVRFGNKLSILGGDFLLARASLYLSRLGSTEVVELVASVLANLVEGEVMQMKGNTPYSSSSSSSSRAPTSLTPEIFQHYMTKTYLKTASLIAKSSRAAVVLGGCGANQGWVAGEKIKEAAYSYGRNLGIAFQLIDDMLDYTASSKILGKPSAGADLKLGLATAPALFAWEEYSEMGPLIHRKFEEPGDVDRARDIVARSSGTDKTKQLAARHAQLARDALVDLPDTDARAGLIALTDKVLNRSK